jgi:hypothetical protein
MNFRNVAGSSGNYYSIDGNLETPLDISWQFNNTVSKFFVQFSFNKTYKKASDSSALEGARVYIEDADGTQATNATTNASGVLAEQVLTKETYRYLDGDTPTALTPHVVKVRKYGYLFTEVSISVDAKIEGVDFVGDNPFVVANEATAAAYTGITLNGATSTITVSGARTLQELYDYSQWWAAQSGNIQYDEPLLTSDGLSFALASGWSISVTGALTGAGTLAAKPTVASGGFFEDADGAIWEAGGDTNKAAAFFARVVKASDSSDIEGAVIGFGDKATQARLGYNTSLAADTFVTDADGEAEGYLAYDLGGTTYAEKTLVVGEYNHNFLEIPQSIDGAPVGSSTTRQEYRLGTDAQVTKTKAQAAAITGVVVDVPTDTIDLGGNTLADAYDSLKYQVTADADIDTGVPGCMYACLYGLPLTKSGTTYTARSATTVYQGVTIGTDTFAGGIVEWDTPGTYAGGTWNGNTFRFTAAGTYDFRSAEFIGTVVLTATVPGVIVQVAPSVSYDDTDPNVTVDASVAITIANANLIDGSRVQLYNVTQDAEMENTTVSGGAGYSYTATLGPGQEVEDGDTIRLRATWASGASYKENYEETNAASSSGITFLGTQTDWAAANGLGIDGSLQTEFTADYPNVQVDITASGNLFNVGDLVAWLCHIQTTADGIRNFFGGLEGQDAGNWIIQSATVDLRLDNTSAQTAVQGDNVILVRDDRVYPQAVPTSGGGIGMLMGGSVFIVETGVSGLTPAESSKLLAIPTAADVWAVDLSGAAAADSAADVVKKAKGAAEGAFAVSV